VGNTPSLTISCAKLTVHPHGCGEHARSTQKPRSFIGSSPRVWGTHGFYGIDKYLVRFIPTGVGNTNMFLNPTAGNTVHPHGCGEHTTKGIQVTGNVGSSPRVWGTLSNAKHYHKQGRFIPTGVGNTGYMLYKPLSVSVHPHGCGEHIAMFVPGTVNRGSSPRVWGTRSSESVSMRPPRFIPTGVGNTINNGGTVPADSVHPHGCGEHALTSPTNTASCGSSPRVWGTLPPEPAGTFNRRFIPTGVGNTTVTSRGVKNGTVHPHGCGEHYA